MLGVCEILQIRILLISERLQLRTYKLLFVSLDWAWSNGTSPRDWPYGVMASMVSQVGTITVSSTVTTLHTSSSLDILDL